MGNLGLFSNLKTQGRGRLCDTSDNLAMYVAVSCMTIRGRMSGCGNNFQVGVSLISYRGSRVW